jgi:hypothetical protein
MDTYRMRVTLRRFADGSRAWQAKICQRSGLTVTHSELGSADILARISRVRFDQYLHQSDMENIKVESPGECSPLLASDRNAHGAVG